MGVSLNGGTQQPWLFLLKMIILGCFGGTDNQYNNQYVGTVTRRSTFQLLFQAHALGQWRGSQKMDLWRAYCHRHCPRIQSGDFFFSRVLFRDFSHAVQWRVGFQQQRQRLKETSFFRYIWASYSDLSGRVVTLKWWFRRKNLSKKALIQVWTLQYFTQVYMRYWGLCYLVLWGCAIKHSKEDL